LALIKRKITIIHISITHQTLIGYIPKRITNISNTSISVLYNNKYSGMLLNIF